MASPQIDPAATADRMAEHILRDPGGYYDTPMDVVWDPHLDHDARIKALETWLAHERLLYRGDRDPGRVVCMRQIDSAIRTLEIMRHGEGRP